MRPVARGASPQPTDFENYAEAKPFLVMRLGGYCSYCERYIATQLAVEHIQPKGLASYEHLKGRWENFLLSCVNCNSTKKSKNVILADVLLPDRDNTFLAFTYSSDGGVAPSALAVRTGLEAHARATLELTGLDKIDTTLSENEILVALDRVSQRREAWRLAEESKADLAFEPASAALRRTIVKLALSCGFFSVWMTVFRSDAIMCRDLVDAFRGTRDSGCFGLNDNRDITPAPNPDALSDGGKL